MNIIITMAGLGSRFRNAGYDVPKYEIKVKGKTLFEWSMLSLTDFVKENHIFIVQKANNAVDFIKNECSKLGVEKYYIVEVDYLTKGQAETAMLAKPYWKKEQKLLIYNIDTYIEPGIISLKSTVGDGCIPCFEAEGTHWSFVKIDSTGKALEVKEKERISNNCSIGAYYFKSCSLYERLYQQYYDDHIVEKEKYIAPIYNLLIEEKGEVCIQLIEANFVHVLGTPKELLDFEKTEI